MSKEKFSVQPKRESTPKKLLDLKEAFSQIEMSPEQREQIVQEIYHEMKDRFEKSGGTFHEDVNDIYLKFSKSHPMIVRRDDPRKYTDLVIEEKDISIEHEPDVPGRKEGGYINAAMWDPKRGTDAIRTALMEGWGGRGGIATVAGFVKGEDLKQRAGRPEEQKTFVAGQDRSTNINIWGTIHPEDLRFIILRIPGHLMEKGDLTDEELDKLYDEGWLEDSPEEAKKNTKKNPIQILRGYTFEKIKNKKKAA